MFTYAHTVQLHDTDAYGILFYGNQFRFCHDAFQGWLASVDLPMAPTRQAAEYVGVMVHVEADYTAPIQLGDQLTIELRCGHIGTTSFTNVFSFRNQRGETVGAARTVQVVIDTATSQKKPIPDALREALERNR